MAAVSVILLEVRERCIYGSLPQLKIEGHT